MPSLKIGGNRRCQCAGCELYFNSEGAFTKHRTGSYSGRTRRCMTEAEMLEAGMVKNDSGYWVTAVIEGGFWGSKADEEDDLLGLPAADELDLDDLI